jgi:hypothetical protein
MSTPLAGLLLGAGASYEIGMPLVWDITAELRGWLTSEKLRSLNTGWRAQGTGFSDVVIDELAHVLLIPEMHYENILGYLETQFRRNTPFRREYHGLYSWLVEMVYHILCLRHTNNRQYVKRNLRYYEGISQLVAQNLPLWVFSLNHDVIIEMLTAQFNIPLNCGFSGERVTLPRRDKQGVKTGELVGEVLSGEDIDRGAFHFFPLGTPGVNLLKIHGALDVFTFRDGKDLLRLLPNQKNVSDVIEVLQAANEELVCILAMSPDRVVKSTNEITYADDEGEMQFLRRSLLAGAYKFDSRMSQVLPFRVLDSFRANINYVSSLICIGYGFGDMHINEVIRMWLEAGADRELEIVGPGTKGVPSFLLHIAPQVVLKDMTATEYLDSRAGIVRSGHDCLEKRLSAYTRQCGNGTAQAEMQTFVRQQMERVKAALIEKIGSFPIRNGDLDLDSLGMTAEELANHCMSESRGDIDDILETFLDSKGA